MPEESQSIFYQSVVDVLTQWHLPVNPWAAQIAEQISRGTVQWRQEMDDGHSLHLLRVYAPIIQREEVFLGSVLLNDFFFKAVPAAARRIAVTHFAPVANDLESAYFLAYGQLDIDQLQEEFLNVLVERLPDLYFADDDPEKGIHGQFNTMLTFYKANIEPFPVFVVPAVLLPKLLKRVADWTRILISEEGVYELAQVEQLSLERANARRITVLLSVLGFFFSEDGSEMQGFHKFLSNRMEADLLSPELIKQAFGFAPDEDFDKNKFDKLRRDPTNIDLYSLETAIASFLDRVVNNLNKVDHFYIASKMLPHSLSEFVISLTNNVQIGFSTLTANLSKSSAIFPCRISGQEAAYIGEKWIIGGVKSMKRFNQSLKKSEDRFAIRTALAAYLVSKRLGVQFDGQYPVPRFYNVIFHYGQHSDNEKEVFQQQLDYLVEYARKAEKSITELDVGLKEIRRRILDEQAPEDFSDILGDWDEPALETIAHLESSAKAQVLALGSGFYRLFIFILPQFRPGSQESIDFVQKRFSHSRLAAFTLLALLRGLCGSDGPYYYQSLPRLNTGAEAGIFYVQNKPERADEALRKYGSIVNFARQVSRYRTGHSLLTDWVLLAERLLEDPLGMFSDVLRASPIRIGDKRKDKKWKYKELPGDWDAARGLGVVDSTEYLALYEQLHDLAKEMI